MADDLLRPRQWHRSGLRRTRVHPIATYGRRGDLFRFYELDPAIARLARSQFTALEYSPAAIEIKIGDGRLLLSAESVAENEPLFDILMIDAFSSDSVPVHLLTREAFALYLHRLKPDGVLAINVSNRLVDVRGQVLAQARKMSLTAATIYHQPSPDDWWAIASEWVLLSVDPTRIKSTAIQAAASEPVAIPDDTYQTPWTDDFSSLWSALR